MTKRSFRAGTKTASGATWFLWGTLKKVEEMLTGAGAVGPFDWRLEQKAAW